MLINQNVKLKGGVSKDCHFPDVEWLLCPVYSLKAPMRFSSWSEKPRLLDGREKFYDFTEVLGGDFSVWDDKKQEFVHIDEGVVVQSDGFYVWFEPCLLSCDDEFREVTGDFVLSSYYDKNFRILVRS